jgi:hypothetical protein
MLLSSKTEKYVTPPHVETMGKKAHEFPDSVVDVLLAKAREVPAATYAGIRNPRDITDPPLDLKASKELAVAALKKYDVPLGTRVEAILNDRLEIRDIKDVPAGEDIQQQYVPYGARLKNGEPDPHAGNIRYDCLNNAIDDVIMLGHEAGHGIADDNIRATSCAGADGTRRQCNDGDQLEHMQETQAYFIQQIVYGQLMNNPDIDPTVAEAARQHFAATMTQNIYNLSVADLAKQAQTALNDGSAFNAREAFDARLGPGWEKEKWAKRTFDIITAAQKTKTDQTMPETDRKAALDKLDVEADYVHGRPASLLTALVLYKKTQDNPALKQSVLETVMAAKGPQNIVNALSEAGIVDDAELARQAKAAIDNSTAYIRARQPAPASTQAQAFTPVQA